MSQYHGDDPQWAPQPEPTVELGSQRRPLDAQANVDDLDREYSRVRRGPVRRFAIWASGADTVILDHARVDESDHVLQGTLVVFTSLVATLSGVAAASFLIDGEFKVTFASLIIGVLWGIGIFVLDRTLVASTYNPYRFSKDEIAALTDVYPNAPWQHILAGRTRAGRRQRGRDVLRILTFGTWLRVALALAASWIVAEMALFLIFEPEVNARADYLLKIEQTQQLETINRAHQVQKQANDNERAALTGAGNETITRLDEQVKTLQTRLDAARHDYGVLSEAAGAEEIGRPYSGTLSDGRVVATSGRVGNGPATRSLAARRDNQKAVMDDLAVREVAARAELDKARAELVAANAVALKDLEERTNREVQEWNRAKERINGETGLHGLLRRRNALQMLTNDMVPETVELDPAPACGGFFAWACKLRNWVLPPTPMGPTVLAFRVIFLVIELLPIMFKFLQSLRPRRPYEMAKAVLEHASMLQSTRKLHSALHDVSVDMVRQAAGAKQQLTVYGRAPAPEPEPEREDLRTVAPPWR